MEPSFYRAWRVRNITGGTSMVRGLSASRHGRLAGEIIEQEILSN
jgi:hypothetical protein